jgi:nucleotide-binding universal stress UspA family protein
MIIEEKEMELKILIALDDSENAKRAVEYVANTFTKDHDITLLSILPDTAVICDMNSPELTPYFLSQQTSFCILEDKKKELIELAMKEAKNLLLQAGFSEEKIKIKVESQKGGAAKGIIEEARSSSGYDTIVMGRRGVSGIKDFFFGSVTQKVLHSVQNMSVLLID